MKAVAIAFSMYSKIPMPRFLWEERDRKRAFCFFPLVGAAEGLIFFLVFLIRDLLPEKRLLSAALLTAVPVLFTGGIHMDGFLDTCDARASYAERERRLEILRDPHIGAFAAIRGLIYMIVYYGSCTALDREAAAAVAAGFVFSRVFCVILIAVTPNARPEGMLAGLSRGADRKKLSAAMIPYLIVTAGFLFYRSFSAAFLLLAAAAVSAWYCRSVMMREFGGITGDLAGYFIQFCELAMILTLALFR